MFSLRHLVCCGCDIKFAQNIFLDDDKKRPLFTKCGHTLCSECQKSFPTCPVCKEEVQPVENFAARNIFEDFRKNPVSVFKNWFNSEITNKEPCSNCHESSSKLSLCITCGLESKHLYPERKTIKKKLTRREQLLAMRNKVGISPIYFVEKTFYRTMSFNLLACRVLCSSCILDFHQDHKRKTLLELEYTMKILKQESSWIATRFIKNELKNIDGKCLITKMRIQRTCEKLCHLVNMYYPRQRIVEPIRIRHDRIPSEVNKFFESFGKMDADDLLLEQCNSWIQLLEQQLEELKNQKTCSCESVWDEMHKLSFGNQVEKYFVQVINDLGDQEIFECPLQLEELVEMRNKAEEMSKSKLFKIYTAFCWNYKQNRVCGLFDNLNKKPIACSNCGAATCMKCLQAYAPKCSACGECFGRSREEPKMNTDSLELTAFYINNCVSILEEWWSCEASQLQYCMSCSSYSDNLEVCVKCERIQKNNAVETKQNMQLIFKYSGLEMFPIRWQCSGCKNRLQADFAHQPSIQSRTWTRGCNHLLTRIHPTKKCDGNDLEISKGECNAVSLKHMKNYEIAMKVATSKLVFSILKAGIEEKVKCRMRKMDFLKIYGELIAETRFYLRRMMAEKKLVELEKTSLCIKRLIETLRNKWNHYRETECFCGNFWENSSKLSKIEMREFLKSQEKIDTGVCPLEMYSKESNCDFSDTCLYEQPFL